MRKVIVNRIYRHFKGNTYIVLMIARDVETLEEKVVYRSISDPNKVWVRSLEEFLSEVDHKKYPDVMQKYRFELQKNKKNEKKCKK